MSTKIKILANGEIHQITTKVGERASVEKIGGLNKANKMIKGRQKLEAVENQICFRIDRRDNQQRERAKKRREKRVR